VFGVCIIVAVYVPIFSLEGLERRMFAPMAFIVVVAVLGSLLLLALTYVPMISCFLLQHVEEKPARVVRGGSGSQPPRSRSRTRPSPGCRPERCRAPVAALSSVPFLDTEFMPKFDEGSMLIETRRPPSTSPASRHGDR
jgi:cobalt-zinc-cadmium resistance protein CzcA